MGAATNGRRYRRLVVELPATVAGVAMSTANVSLHGAQIACPQMRYDINAKALGVRPLPLRLELDGGAALEVACRVKYVSSSESEVLLGLQFEPAPEDPALAPLARFLEGRGGARYLEPLAD